MQDDIRDLTLGIYDTVGNPALWPAVLDQVVDRVGAQGSIIFEWARVDDTMTLTAPLHSGFYSQEALQFYLKKCQHLEAQDQAIIRAHTGDHDGVELLDDTLLAPTIDALKAQEHVRKLMQLGIFHRAAGVMNKDNPWISLFSVQLNASRPPLTDAERVFLAQILPHLAKAADLSIPMRQVQGRYQAVLAAIDHLALGLCILDGRGLVVARNQEFQRQQETYRCFRVSPTGQLRIADPEGQAQLDTLMAGAAAHGTYGARPRKEAIASHLIDPLCIEVSPLHQSAEIGSQAFDGFVLCSTDTSLPFACDTDRIQQAFRLTAAEASLVGALGQGLTNPEIADRRGRSVATVTAQVKSILAKSRCANRTQFVRMILRFGASFLTGGTSSPDKLNK